MQVEHFTEDQSPTILTCRRRVDHRSETVHVEQAETAEQQEKQSLQSAAEKHAIDSATYASPNTSFML